MTKKSYFSPGIGPCNFELELLGGVLSHLTGKTRAEENVPLASNMHYVFEADKVHAVAHWPWVCRSCHNRPLACGLPYFSIHLALRTTYTRNFYLSLMKHQSCHDGPSNSAYMHQYTGK